MIYFSKTQSIVIFKFLQELTFAVFVYFELSAWASESFVFFLFLMRAILNNVTYLPKIKKLIFFHIFCPN